ncbi:MAG: cytochrome C oxidase subunit IV family protein [Phycisphaerales bacterium]
MTHEPAKAPLDLTDPHHDLHHGHVIIAPRTLIAVLTVLLVFTVLTVAASRGEVWIADTFDVHIPQSVNVGVIMVIAVIKSALVALYFMQLRYDSILNSTIFLFCLFAVGLFLFFSMIDLGERGIIYSWKSGEIQRGGQGINTLRAATGGTAADGAAAAVAAPPAPSAHRIDTGTRPITVWARDRRLEQLSSRGLADPQARYDFEKRLFAHHGHGGEEALSDANRTVPRRGLTPDLFTPKPAGEAGHEGHGH